jgi:glutamate/tyrosine decarboxylase-like PLP-dependent enzyme
VEIAGPQITSFPKHGTGADELLAEIDTVRGGDIDWRSGTAFSLVYHHDDEGLEALQHAVADRFLHENALNPFAYQSLPRMEQEIVLMAGDLLGGEAGAGSLTSGGTESIFLAVQVARDDARERGIAEPVLLTATTAHPAFAKAAKYLDVEHRLLPVGDDLRLHGETVADALDERAGLVVASAPCYPYGVIDHVADVAAAAQDAEVLCHVDACLGGWLLPFWARLGEPVPPWDLRVPGVTSLSADIHKYGYAYKGASTVLYASRDLYRHQLFLYDDWPGGLYGSSTTAGTRPGPPIAGAWAAIRHLGADGYLRLAEIVRDTTRKVQAGIAAIDGLEVHGDPDLSVFEFGAPALDVFGIGDVMDDRGWHLDRQQGGLHLMLSPGHARVADRFLADLADAVAHHDAGRGRAATYGGVT